MSGAPGVFELRAYVDYDAVTGKRRWLHATYRGTRPQAEAALDDVVSQADAEAGRVAGLVRRPKARSSLTVAEACERWFDWAMPRLESGSRVTARENIDRYIVPRLGAVEVWRLRGHVATVEGDPDHDPRLVSVTEFYDELTESGGSRRKGLSPATVRRVHATLRAVLKFAVSQSWVAANAAAEARVPSVPRRTSTAPDPTTLRAFMAFLADDNPALLAFVHVMTSGGRRVDGLGLQWLDVDFDAGEIVLGQRGVVRSLDQSGPRRAVVRETATTKRRRRRVAMSSSTESALRRHRQRCVEEAWGTGARLSRDCFVFSPDPDGLRPRNPDWASTEWRRATSRAARQAGIEGLERVRLYDVRHFFATRLLAAGVKEVEIAQLMGNAPSTMRYHYASAISLGGEEAAAVMDELLGETRPSPKSRQRRTR